MPYELINNRNSQLVGTFEALDAARRVIIDRRLRFWSIFQGEQLIESACTHFIPGIDDREVA